KPLLLKAKRFLSLPEKLFSVTLVFGSFRYEPEQVEVTQAHLDNTPQGGQEIMTDKVWMDVKEFCQMVGSSLDHIYDLIAANKFPGKTMRLGRRIKIDSRSVGLYEPPAKSSRNDKAGAPGLRAEA